MIHTSLITGVEWDKNGTFIMSLNPKINAADIAKTATNLKLNNSSLRLIVYSLFFPSFQVLAGTWVWINYYNISRNEEIYPEPDTFNIDRLLDADGKVLPEDHPVRAK